MFADVRDDPIVYGVALDFPALEQTVRLRRGVRVLCRRQIEDRNRIQRQAATLCIITQLRGGLAQGHEQGTLGGAPAQDLRAKRGLATAGAATDQVGSARDQPTARDLVEAGEAGSEARIARSIGVVHEVLFDPVYRRG